MKCYFVPLCAAVILFACGRKGSGVSVSGTDPAPVVAKQDSNAQTPNKETVPNPNEDSKIFGFADAKIHCAECHDSTSTVSSWKGVESEASWSENAVKIYSRVNNGSMPLGGLPPDVQGPFLNYVAGLISNVPVTDGTGPMTLAQAKQICASCHGSSSGQVWSTAGTEEGWRANKVKIKEQITSQNMPLSPISVENRQKLLDFVNTL